MNRRFVNMVVHEHGTRLYSLRRLNVAKHLFYPSAEDAAAAAAAAQEAAKSRKKTRHGWPPAFTNRKRMPSTEISFTSQPCLATASTRHFFFALLPGQGEGCVMATDPSCNTAVYDADMKSVLPMPRANLYKAAHSISLSITKRRRACRSTRSHEDDHALYVMSRWNGSFEFFTYCSTRVSDYLPANNSWYWCSLPRLPPWLGDGRTTTGVVSRPFAATVVGNAIWVSSEHGTYRYDISKGAWSQAGSWVLPFHGSAEHVPELGLWFGVEDPGSPGHRLCAFDLSSCTESGSGPATRYDWDYLDSLLDGWLPSERRLVNLGSGRFCIVTYCMHVSSASSDEEGCTKVGNEELTLLTGVELLDQGGDGIRMIKHKSQRYNIQNFRIHCVL